MRTIATGIVLATFLYCEAVIAASPIQTLDEMVGRLANQLVDEHYEQAYATLWDIDQLRIKHQLGVPDSYWYYRGVVANERKDFRRAKTSLEVYQTISGSSGRFVEAAGLLLSEVTPKAAVQIGDSALNAMLSDRASQLMGKVHDYTMNVTVREREEHFALDQDISTVFIDSWKNGGCHLDSVTKTNRIITVEFGEKKKQFNKISAKKIALPAGSSLSLSTRKSSYVDVFKIYFPESFSATYNGKSSSSDKLTLYVKRGKGEEVRTAFENYLDFCNVSYSTYVKPEDIPVIPDPIDHRALVGDRDMLKTITAAAQNCDVKQCDIEEVTKYLLKQGAL